VHGGLPRDPERWPPLRSEFEAGNDLAALVEAKRSASHWLRAGLGLQGRDHFEVRRARDAGWLSFQVFTTS